MKKFVFTGLLAILVLVTATNHVQAQQAKVAITLERTACFGACPIYTVTILEDGTVIYKGEKFVAVTGEQTSQIDPAIVKQMVDAFASAGYFDWKEAYDTMTVTDMPTIITSVTRDGKQHRITRYVGDSSAPLALPYLETWIDVMTNTHLWTGVASDFSTISTFGESPLLTLQRDACFGMCPVYAIAAYEDGKVVYVGIANVSKIGVQVFEVDAAAIAHVAQIADLSGYFDWSDSYQKQVITDQATVTTSVRGKDQFKHIVRYKGDPNAPIGLVQIEDSIDQLIADKVS
ncbi:MAG: hypothetical protein KF716_32735 [Anaerolineae bacterium]|nr:hypothetical protein [Anaerolineae bacterium]